MGGFEAGDEVGRYRLERKLGEGGMGTVWVALQEGLGRRVALKLLHPTFAADANVVGRFRREAELAASFGHPNIVQVTDFGVHDGRPFLVMDLLEGESLAQRMGRGTLEPQPCAFIAAQVLSALEVAHERDVVHRDLKPDNIFLTSLSGVRDIVKLLDFGIARLVDPLGDGKMTTTGQVLGTPAYMSPEQARGSEVDVRADLYSLGVVMYEALGGRLPFSGGNYHQLMFAIVDETPPALASLRSGLPDALVAVVERAMQKDPETRFQTAVDMRAALEEAVPTRVRGPDVAAPMAPSPSRSSSAPVAFAPTLATPPAVAPLPTQRGPQSRWPLVAGLVSLGAIGTVVGFSAFGAFGASEDATLLSEVAEPDQARWASAPDDVAEPATLEPATPEPATLEPETPEPATSTAPATPELATPEPATPEPETPEPATSTAPAMSERSRPSSVGAGGGTTAMSTMSPRGGEGERYRMIPCGQDGALREHVVVRASDVVQASFLSANNVLSLPDLRSRVQSEAASAALTACYVGHPLNPGQRLSFELTATGAVEGVSLGTYCPSIPEVRSCLARWLRTVDFSGVVAEPGGLYVGLGL